MTNEEKARETYPYFEDMNDIELVQANAKRLGFIAGCEWKDEQFEAEKQALIDKACEWLEDNAINYVGKDGRTAWRSVFADFRKAMKGGKNE